MGSEEGEEEEEGKSRASQKKREKGKKKEGIGIIHQGSIELATAIEPRACLVRDKNRPLEPEMSKLSVDVDLILAIGGGSFSAKHFTKGQVRTREGALKVLYSHY